MDAKQIEENERLVLILLVAHRDPQYNATKLCGLTF